MDVPTHQRACAPKLKRQPSFFKTIKEYLMFLAISRATRAGCAGIKAPSALRLIKRTIDDPEDAGCSSV